jgi:RimJ/RimL family protein N-acetyltransferase
MIETSRLVLREVETGDAAFVVQLLNEPAFIQNIGDRGVRTQDDALRWIESGPRANYASLGFGHYAVVLKETDEPIGICGLRTRAGLEHPDLGYAILEQYWGHGYAVEAARAILDYSRRSLGMRHLLAICAPANRASIVVLEKLGFHFQMTTRLPGEDHDVMVYGMDLPDV